MPYSELPPFPPPWPRAFYNYPIILCGIALQYVWAIALLLDSRVINITAIYPLIPHLHFAFPIPVGVYALASLLFATASLSLLGFFFKKKIHTLFSFIPQQFIMVVSSIGAIHSMIMGRFADGTVRPYAFLFADQSPIILLTVFHTWAMVLILLHAGDNEE